MISLPLCCFIYFKWEAEFLRKDEVIFTMVLMDKPFRKPL